MRLVLPLPPLTGGNERGKWQARHGRRVRYFDLCDMKLAAGLVPKPPARPYPRIRLAAVLFVWNEMDEDNAHARLKHALDWIVSRGYVEGDRRKHIERADGFGEQRIERRRHMQRVELDLSLPTTGA